MVIYYSIRQARAERRIRMSWLARWNELNLPVAADTHEDTAKKEAMKFLNAEYEAEKDGEDITAIQAQDVVTYGHILPYGIYWKKKLYMARLSKKYRLQLSRRFIKEIKDAGGLKHENLANFEGACLDPDHVLVIYEYCSKGSLMVRGASLTKFTCLMRTALVCMC